MLLHERPVTFDSHTLTQSERSYSQIEKECQARVFGCTTFDHYPHGRTRITARTDHKPLETILHKLINSAPKRCDIPKRKSDVHQQLSLQITI